MASILFEETSLKPIRRKQLLNNIVDGLAKVRPGTIYAEVPRSATSYECGYRKISYADFANAINGLAHWLHDTLGPAENFPTLAYIGPNDFRYNALMLAAVKAGIPAHANLFKILECKVLITVNPVLPMTHSIIEATGARAIECPDVDELLDNIYPHYPFNKTFEQARKEPLVVLHTSGTTGFPKPIVWNHEWVASWSDWLAIAPPDGYTNQTALWTSSHSENRYEAVLIRNTDSEKVQPIFSVFPSLNQWETHDLYAPHPSIPDLWLYSGRSDDIIVLLTGEKTNPVSMEQQISHHPEVRAALVIGAHRFQTALLIELISPQALSTVERAKAIERIWPTIQQANQECPRHAKVAKSHVFFTSPDKPMGRSGKGMVQRQPTLDLYSKEIDNLYADADKMSSSTSLNLSAPEIEKLKIDMNDSISISRFIHDNISQLIGSITFQDEDDLFIRGMLDSLQTLRLTRILKNTFAIPELEITTLKSREQGIHDSLVEYKAILDEIAPPDNQTHLNGVKDADGTSSEEKIFVLTGSTGTLGSYILQTLLSSSAVSHVFCLNRTAGEQPQIKRSKAHGLPTEFPSNRVTFLQANLSEERLGLEPEIFEKVKASATHIIHNAWPVNFNIPLSSFYPNIKGVINLLEFAATASQTPSLMFLSSLSSVGNFSGDVPENVITDTSASLPMGYSESKFIAENLLAYAADKFSHVSISIARVGQIAGPVSTTGIWNKHEWFPSLVLSSIHLRIIPESLDSTDRSEVDWVPIDLIADILVELVLSQRNDHNHGAKVYHPVNPVLVPWKSLLPRIIETATEGQENKITPVPFAKWIERVRKDAEDLHSKIDFEEMLEKNPAIKLLSFYEGLAKGRGTSILENKKTVQASGKLHSVGISIM
ncbi:hypothetical protein BELL_1497g00010 [Botrytis elliptica]|uniref:Carrier domain-containing protein n=1 Tax=Botrytis elliptica TaxID=278938 RepID=A0A4Z1I0B7_9HELO|nr:hypothetical protein BELL_1497g00010 [Botrytis elliptica]